MLFSTAKIDIIVCNLVIVGYLYCCVCIDIVALKELKMKGDLRFKCSSKVEQEELCM